MVVHQDALSVLPEKLRLAKLRIKKLLTVPPEKTHICLVPYKEAFLVPSEKPTLAKFRITKL